MNITEQYFKENVNITQSNKNKESTYYEFEFDEMKFYFCISTHHGKYRGKIPTFISNNQSLKKAKGFAWELYVLHKKKEISLNTDIRNNDHRRVKRYRDRIKKRFNTK